ncbi:MAG: arylamine N-acetyltransferase [Coriobacteriia bacterium]|nr:arylamine N-acetyltransferase [Coriobacteriia bacterium]
MVTLADIPEFLLPRYGKYYAPLPDLDAYLKRIGLEGEEIPLTREGLDKVIWAHLSSVPFENIDLFDYDLVVDFGIEELFDKVVTRHRGGYCFELNAIFMALLTALGFEVYPIGVRIVSGGEAFIPAIAHRSSIIVIDDKRYFADVGFGMTSAAGGSICVDDTEEQQVRDTVFHVEDRPNNHKIIMRHKEEGPATEFLFIPDPFPAVDFVAYNYMMARTGFRNKRIANLRTEDGALSVDGNIFRKTINGERIETPIENAEEAMKILTEVYGMVLTEPLQELAETPPPQA